MTLLARSVLGLAAGLLTVSAIDYFVWPGTFMHGAVGVVVAVAVLALMGKRDAAA